MSDENPIIDLVGDVLAVLDRDDPLLASQNTSIQAEIDALEAQLIALRAQLAGNVEKQGASALFRALAASIADGSAAGSVVVPASPPPTAAPEPMTAGITTTGV